MIARRLPIGVLRADPEALRRELARDRARLNEGNRWRTDPARLLVDASSTIDLEERVFYADDDVGGGPMTVTLLASPENGQMHTVKKIGTSGSVTLDGNGKNIDGSASHILSAQFESVTVHFSSELDEWLILGSFP